MKPSNFRFIGFNVTQIYSHITNKWCVYIHTKVQTLDDDGVVVPGPHPISRRFLIYAGLKDPLSFQQLKGKWNQIIKTVEDRIEHGQPEICGMTERDMVEAGVDLNSLKRICG